MCQPYKRRPKPYWTANLDGDLDPDLQEVLWESRKDKRFQARQSRPFSPVGQKLPTENPGARAKASAAHEHPDGAATLTMLVTGLGRRPNERPTVHKLATSSKAEARPPPTNSAFSIPQSRRANVTVASKADDRDIQKELELDRERCIEDGRERPKEVYDAFDRYKKETKKLPLSDMGLLAELHVLAKIVGVKALTELAIETLWKVWGDTQDVSGLNSVLMMMSYQKHGNTERLETWVGDLLKEEGVVDDLTRLADFNVNLRDDEGFWRFVVELGCKTIRVSKRGEFVRSFWIK